MDIKKPIEGKSKSKGVTVRRLSPVLEADLNKHIQAEAYSSNIYLAMASWCEDKGYLGGAKRFKQYAEEERTHMHKIYSYLLERDLVPITPEIPMPNNNYSCILDVIEAGYKHEIGVSDSYHITADLCMREKDYTTFQFVQWFIGEQIEEEAKFADLINQYNILMSTGVTGVGLMEFDEILGEY